MPLSILFVHQGYELYGSDRTLIQSIEAATAQWPDAKITVLLPREGSLAERLRGVVQDVRISNLAILRKSNLKTLSIRDAGSFLQKVLDARRMMRSHDLTYINTVLVMDYLLAACLVRGPRVVHVHEIPTGPANLFFSAALALSRAFLLFNSFATQRSFHLPFWQRSAVVWNGASAPPPSIPDAPHSTLNLLVIGRFNSWKGQSVLLNAVAQLSATSRARVNVRLVGGVFETQIHFSHRLEEAIRILNLANQVQMFPFTPDPSAHYAWADVVVVPSTKPEPFGLVAIEAMAAGRAVIASNHGGLAEIVLDGVTGSLVSPGSSISLLAAIESYLQQPSRILREGEAGRERFASEFEQRHYKTKIANILAHWLEPSPAQLPSCLAIKSQQD